MIQSCPTTSEQFQQSRQKNEEEQKQIQVVKKKPNLLKKKKMPPTKLFSNVDLKHVVNINDICFVNQQSLRYPDSSEETLLKTLYHYKLISKVTLNNSYINIELKKNQDNYLPPEYFVERLRSFGDQTMANIAGHLENIHKQFNVIKEACPVKQKIFAFDREELLLKLFVQKMEGRKYFLYFSQISPERTNMKNIIFSVPLLQALGCNIKNIAMDFLKYKHMFFEVFTAKNYRYFIDSCLQNFAKIQAMLMRNPDLSEQEKEELTTINYTDEIIHQKQGPEGIYEEISSAKVRWFSPHPSICCFEILEMNETDSFTRKKRKIQHFEESKPEEELEELRKIGLNYPILKIQNRPKIRPKNEPIMAAQALTDQKKCEIDQVASSTDRTSCSSSKETSVNAQLKPLQEQNK